MKKLQLTSIILILVAIGCSSSKITSRWKQPGVAPVAFKKVMVIGVMRPSERSFRENMENHIVGDLRSHGYNAQSSFALYGPNGFVKMDTLAVYNKLLDDSVDAVLTIVLVKKEREKYKVPGRVYSTYNGYASRFPSYYFNMQMYINEPDHYEVRRRYFWESNLYDLQGKQILYSVQTESFDPASAENLGHEYGKLIVNDMIQAGILQHALK